MNSEWEITCLQDEPKYNLFWGITHSNCDRTMYSLTICPICHKPIPEDLFKKRDFLNKLGEL